MNDAAKRAEDFFAANPGQQYLATRGAIHTSDGRNVRPATEGNEMTDRKLLEMAAKAAGIGAKHD